MSLWERIVNHGEYFVIRDYPFKAEVVERLQAGFYSAMDITAPLRELHRHVHPDQVIEIQDWASRVLKREMLQWSVRLAKDVLGLQDPFYLDLMTIARVKPPFEFSRRSTLSYAEYSRRKGRMTFQADPSETAGYHNDLPFPSWNHGPHMDSWFGHSFNGINLWWAVDRVMEDTGMVFYPDIVGQDLKRVNEPPYVARDVPLSKPAFFNLAPGDVIAFNSDTLHATRINLTDTTRVSFSTRLNPKEPRFNLSNFRHVKYWVRSDEVEILLKVPDNEACHRVSA